MYVNGDRENFFFSCWRAYGIQGNKQEVKKVVSLYKNDGKIGGVPVPMYLNPIALRTAKTLRSFGCSGCSRV